MTGGMASTHGKKARTVESRRNYTEHVLKEASASQPPNPQPPNPLWLRRAVFFACGQTIRRNLYFVVCLFVLSITLQSARLSLGAICLRGTRPRRFCDIKRSCSRCHHKATTMMTAAVAAKRLLNRQSFTRARSCVTRLDLRWSSSATESTDYLSDRCNLNIVSR